MNALFWGILASVFLIIELLIPALVSIWYAIAGFIMIFVSFKITDLKTQILIFAILSFVLLILTKKAVNRLYKNQISKKNIYENDKVVISNVLKDGYEVRYKGTTWLAISDDKFEINENAFIKEFQGNKIIIKKGE